MNSVYTDKEVLSDGLNTQKATTGNYNMFSNECCHENVRNVMLDILADEHDIQDDVFHMMSSKGYYPTQAAQEQKIMQTRQKFQSGVK